MPVGTAQFGQADLSKTEADTEAPMPQLGRATASSSILGRVWLVSKLFEPKTQRTEPNRTPT